MTVTIYKGNTKIAIDEQGNINIIAPDDTVIYERAE